jgi:acyl dehydratase
MSVTQQNYISKPKNGPAMFRALVLPRKGFNSSVGLPAIKATWTGAQADQKALTDYLATLNLAQSPNLPILYPHVMAGSMHMNMLSHKTFPIRLLGSVHLKNRITQYQAIPVNAVMDLHSEIASYRLVEKGLEFDFTTVAKINGETVWDEVSIYFQAGRFGGKTKPSEEKSFELDKLADAEKTNGWKVPNNRGKKYAKITGDYNPIHMSPLTAKLFGFKRDIAHGFGVLAEAIEYSAAIEQAGGTEKQLQVDVVFKGPIYLNSDVHLRQNAQQNASRFDVYCGDNPKPSICGEVLSV